MTSAAPDLFGQAIAEKVAHVRSAGQSRAHHCHWPECDRQVPPAQWGCKEHWYKLPQDLRSRIWRAYRIGQEESGRPSETYLEVAREVQAWIAAQQEQAAAAQASITDGLPACPGPGWIPNTGRCPNQELKRIRVVLRHGAEPAYADALNPMAPPGWAAETTCWALLGSPFDVAWYLPL